MTTWRSTLVLALILSALASSAHAQPGKKARYPAQDPPRFAPPRPPALDQDFEDPAEDELENGDSPNRAQVPPPAGVPTPTPPPPGIPDFKSPAPAGPQGPVKLKFELANGEYYEKGKKRGRSPIAKRTTQSVNH